MTKVDKENIEEDSEGELVVGGRRLTNLRYADDTTLLASTQEKAKKIFKDLILESAQYNMQINAKKTKTLVVTRNEGIQAKLEHEGEYLDQVKDFKFLGSYKSADGDCVTTRNVQNNVSGDNHNHLTL